ncbi:CpsD/CapB family tyrosine-protein kinase [uncultured Endozoicomonas sp.]|uniref:CpsD/CapB family tyrosine-protein kinase n=1 Tax=uncultured Endozoicomonas sp. TaxID=432652 RepID=UPI0026186772|nr:CpsD/CapB family tyrosine-protein kinase [uncultured Endozoicomonas sp.]
MIKLPVNYLEIEEIYSNSLGKGMRSLAVTAANPGEGCSTLAYALSKRSELDGKKTLLVEVNMLHPELGDISGHQHTDWFPTAQSADANIMRTNDLNLDVLPAPCDSDILRFRNIATMSKLMQHWLENYDAVIFDTSPVNARNRNNIPAETVCAMVDGAVFMVMAGVTQQTQFKTALDRLTQNDVSLVGVVFNDYQNPRMVDEIYRETYRLDKWFPGTMEKFRRYIKRSSFFNIQL